MGQKRKIFLDTNAVIYYLRGIDGFELIGDYKAFYYSFITEIELHSVKDDEQEKIISEFLKKGKRININDKIISQAIDIRKTKHLKTPDAIIVASAKINQAELYTSDEEILKKIDDLKIVNLLKD